MPSDFVTTLRGLLDRQRDGKPASCASVGIFLGNHAEAILRVVEAARKRNSMAYEERVTRRELEEALAALDKEI